MASLYIYHSTSAGTSLHESLLTPLHRPSCLYHYICILIYIYSSIPVSLSTFTPCNNREKKKKKNKYYYSSACDHIP